MQQSFRSVAIGRLLEASRVSKTRQALLVPNEPDYESGGQEFESLRARHSNPWRSKANHRRSDGESYLAFELK